MFVQNQISHLDNHRDVILRELKGSDMAYLMVAYIRNNGVDAIIGGVHGKHIKVLCSLDMGITQLSGIKKLLMNGVEVKFYGSTQGTFHPKVWLFRKNEQWKMLIGSANLTRSALMYNVEASVLVEDHDLPQEAVRFFNYLWKTKNAHSIDLDEITVLQEKIDERYSYRDTVVKMKEREGGGKQVEMLLEYVKGWIDIPKFTSGGISSLWRGWYIIPDQGYVDDRMIENLKSYLPFIREGVHVSKDKSDDKYEEILALFVKNSNFRREIRKMDPHELFVRQAKNYLIKFEWCHHQILDDGRIDKKVLRLTSLGEQIDQCENLALVKELYTDYFFNFQYNGLKVVPFTKKLLMRLGHLTLNEFNYFVVHSYTDDDFEMIVRLIETYRSLLHRNAFHASFVEYFNQIKEGTAKSVYGNYIKSIKHTMSAIGWCDGFSLSESFILGLK